MLAQAVESYVELRQACGLGFQNGANLLRSFAAFSRVRDKDYVSSKIALQWAGLAPSVYQRARRLRYVTRFAQWARLENQCHEVPPPIFGSEHRGRPVPYILSQADIQRLVKAASASGSPTLRRHTYGTLFALLACTGLRVSEAIQLRYQDITPDGLVIRRTKFRKSRLVPLHDTARAGLERYLEHRRSYAPFDDHVFVSLQKKPLCIRDVETAFREAATKAGLPCGTARPRATPHSLRHTFAVRALETCPDDRNQITKHMMALSTYLGHSKVSHTYWYLEATPELMKNIAESCESFVTRAQP